MFHPETTVAQSPAVGVSMENARAILPRSLLRGKESRAHRVTHGWRPRQDSKRSQEHLIFLDLWLNTALLFHVIRQRRGRATERQIKFSRSPVGFKVAFFRQMLGHAKPGLPANAAIFEVVLVVFSQRLKTEITLGLQVRTGRSDRVVGQR